MRLNSSYNMRILNENRIFKDTILYYRRAVNYIIDIALIEYDNYKDLWQKEAQSYIERKIHTTSSHKAQYAKFDSIFYKMPSYLRRTAITEATGIVSSYKKLVAQWEKNGKKGGKPFLSRHQKTMPCFFKQGMFEIMDDYQCRIKIYKDKDWKWHTFRLRKSDCDYINRRFGLNKGSAPVLEKCGHRYCLRFTFNENVSLTDNNERVCSVDLGVNTDAVCTIIDKGGTVIARRFISSAREKDRLYTILNQIKKAHSYGAKKTRKLWAYANNYNKEISIATAKGIINFAAEYDADIIVFEYLDIQGKKYGNNKQKLAIWKKQDIQRRTTHMAHRLGMRITHVSARNTSKLAFDGSGEVKRDKQNYSLCTFNGGKQYNCDLNASYNIGARYYIREILKSLSESERLSIVAKVPECDKRTQCTLSTFIRMNAVL